MSTTLGGHTSSLSIRPRKRWSMHSMLNALARWLCRPTVLLFWVAFGAYLAFGYWLTFRSHAVVGDAWSRVALANQVLTSRDPSLADIGFVWSPLPTLALIPLVALAGWIPSMVSFGFSSAVLSALCMAGTVVVFERIAADLEVRAKARGLLVCLFALSPIIVLYAANGMSEACEMLALMLALRQLMKWLQKGESHHLASAGLFIAVAYLTRYEPVVSAAAVGALVGLVTLRRTSGTLRSRRDVVVANVAVVSFPPALAFLGWAGFSWLIVGQPFEQFSSAYGNSTQVVPQSTGEKGSLSFLVQQLVIVAPLLPILVVAALPLAWKRRDWRPLGALAVLGTPLLFNAAGAFTGRTLGWLRFQIAAAPLAAVLVAWMLGALSAGGSSRRSDKFRQPTLAVIAAILIITSTAVITVPNIQDWDLAPEETGLIQALQGVDPRDNVMSQTTHLGERKIASWLDDQNLPKGSVLMDAFLGFPIQLKTTNPSQFVVNADRDFTAVLADPIGSGIEYILVPSGRFLTELDAVNRAYPDLYQRGAPFVELVKRFEGSSLRKGGAGIELGWSLNWKLYRVSSAQEGDDFLGAAGVRAIVGRNDQRR